jgi:hypothetical protein
MPKPVVLLTATIFPEDMPFLKRADPVVREADYRWALKGWLDGTGYDTLIFCENSGASLNHLEEYARQVNRHKHRVIFLSAPKSPGARELGKGYGEMEIIQYALDNVPTIDPRQLIVKVTGRLRAANATRLLRRLELMQGDIFCSLRAKLTQADSRLFAITSECAREHFFPRKSDISDHKARYIEHALGDAVHSTILGGGTWSPLPCSPLLFGHHGTSGERFGYSPFLRIRSQARHFLINHTY